MTVMQAAEQTAFIHTDGLYLSQRDKGTQWSSKGNVCGLKTNQPWGSFAWPVRHHLTMTQTKKAVLHQNYRKIFSIKTAGFSSWNNHLVTRRICVVGQLQMSLNPYTHVNVHRLHYLTQYLQELRR